MKFKYTFLVVGAPILASIIPAIAADEKPPTISRGYTLEVKPGQMAEFEAGMKKQIEWYKQNNETWQWHAWELETGAKTGQFVFRSPGHYWKDIDDRSERTARASSHFEEAVLPHLESIQGNLGRTLPDVSDWPDELGIPAMVSVHEFNLNYGRSEWFLQVIEKIHGAIQESNWGLHYVWITRVSGGEVPTFFLVIPHKNWADMEGPEKPFRTMLEETLGKKEAVAVMAGLRECVRKESAALARYRPELSYIPSGEE